MNKQEVFKKELSYITDDNIRESLSIMIDKIPDYFFTIPAASTGKYHPEYAQGEGGLVRHTKAAVRMAVELYGIYKFPQKSKDLIIMALVCDCIASHMGRFNTSDYSEVILPLPKTPEQKFVHMCDFLASRKVIKIEFDANNNIIDD